MKTTAAAWDVLELTAACRDVLVQTAAARDLLVPNVAVRGDLTSVATGTVVCYCCQCNQVLLRLQSAAAVGCCSQLL